jgi:hypothetical protein
MSLSSAGRVRPILFDTFTSDPERPKVISKLRDMARQAGWEILQTLRTSPHGAPFFKDMYFEAAKLIPNCTFYGFTNADIIFDDGLIETLEAALKVIEFFSYITLYTN